MGLELLRESLEERGLQLLEDSRGRGFCIYVMKQPVCHIREIYVQPKERKKGLGRAMADLVSEYAREAGCTHLYSQIELGRVGAQESLAAHLAYGFKVMEAKGGWLTMERKIP